MLNLEKIEHRTAWYPAAGGLPARGRRGTPQKGPPSEIFLRVVGSLYGVVVCNGVSARDKSHNAQEFIGIRARHGYVG